MNNNKNTDFTNLFGSLANSSKPLRFAVPTITGRTASEVDNMLVDRTKERLAGNVKTKTVYYASDLGCSQHDWRAMQRHFDIFYLDSNGKPCVKDKKEFRKAYTEYLSNPGKYQIKVTAYGL